MRFSTVFRATAALLVIVIAASNMIDLLGGPHNYVLDPGELDSDAVPGIDTDGDGLKDIYEDVNLDGKLSSGELYPTDPYDPDTDGDGLDDGDEAELFSNRALNTSSAPNWLLRFHQDPGSFETTMASLGPLGDIDGDGKMNILDPDSDGDGILDGEEIAGGLDPLDPDTDGDTIPDPEDDHNGFSVDEDSDGMDDQWERWYDLTGPNEDLDGDGLTNVQEFIKRSDPTRSDSGPGHFGTFSTKDLTDHRYPFLPLMQVSVNEPRYFRVATFSFNNGREWERDTEPAGVQEPEGNTTFIEFDLTGYWLGDLPHTSNTLEIDLEHIFPTYPARNRIVDMRFTDPSVPVPALRYIETLREPSYGPGELSLANMTASVSSRYFQVPPSVPQDIWDLARSWARESPSQRPFMLAEHMVERIFERCQYSLESNYFSSPEDPTYRFFMLTRKGNALDYASGFTIMMRMSGVPARLVMGYALGTIVGDSRVVYKGHLHAWSEIYIEGYGWIPFEVTEHTLEPLGGSGVRAAGRDPYVYGPYGGDGGGTLVGRIGGDLDPDLDEDNDNLTNGQELIWGTDPMNPDHDGDDLLDGREVYLYHTDPLDPDTDDDYLYDGDEVNVYGTDPNNRDTDNGSVPDGTEVFQVPPLDPHDPSDDYQFSDIDGDGLLNDQEEAFKTNPLDRDSDRDNLTDGAEVLSFRTDPLSRDTDGDNISDADEVLGIFSLMFSNPLKNDTDGDGLDDLMEIIVGTHPSIFDTDNDGRGDGEELLMEPFTDPLDPDTDGDGLLDGRELQLLTDPDDDDTDNDGLSDGFEFWSGSNPTNKDDPVMMMDMDGDGLEDAFELKIGTSVSKKDTDGDGLEDGMEYIMGSDPADNDTDGDGLDDGSELFEHFTSLNLNDTDGDGLGDRMEVLISTSPRMRDTDRDGLPDLRELDLGTSPLKPDTDGGGITDQLEVSFQKDPLDPADDRPFPEDQDGDGLPDLIELNLNTSASDPDTDGDGLTDGLEFFILGTDPLDPDSDNDELDDGSEVELHLTDPLDPDTDNDGLDDGKEVKNRRSSPLLPDTDSDGLTDGLEDDLGTGPRNPDTDGDGLLDGVEHFTTGTDPLDPDTDNGTVPDGEEVEFGGDPLDPKDDALYRDTDGDGLLDMEEDVDLDGIVDENETDPNDPDTDDDGVWDSYELRGVLGTPSDPLDPDTDDDALLDGEELLPGSDGFISDPTMNDTDGDGIDDPDEVFGTYGWKSDPSKPDGDGDSLTDPQEVFTSNTDPLDPDTDDDGLPDGWIDGWGGRPRDGLPDPGEYEDRDLDGLVDGGEWNNGAGPGETDPLKFDSDGGGVGDGDELFHKPDAFDPLDGFDDEFIKDSDGDGLTDIEENSSTGTNWLSIDTDGDGMADGYLDIEVDGKVYPGELTGHNGWGPTDPLKAHSDMDGLMDGVEYNMRTDPNEEDTDQDGLYDGRDVAFGPDGDPHFGELTGRNKFSPFDPYGPTDPLDPDSDDDGLWDGDNIPLGDSFFYGEYPIGTDPNDADSDDDGLSDLYEFNAEYDDPQVKWSDSPSNEKKTDPLDPDTDDGGMIDGLEVERSLNPLDPNDDDNFLDPDADGLLNKQEKYELSYSNSTVDWNGDGQNDIRTNWEDPDTDDDGLTDGVEALVHYTNPLNNDTDGDGLLDGEEVLLHRTDPLSGDSDKDGLSDETEVTHVFDNWQSYVDWNGDGVLDNRTDPNNPNTDLDGDNDGREVRYRTNPLDPGDPGSEYQPEKGTFVIIETAPAVITKTADPLRGSFRVTGLVKSEDGSVLEGIWVSILVVPRGTDPDTAMEMERNPSFVVGTASTDEKGAFIIGCTPIGTIPHGEVSVYAVTRQTRSEGRLFLPSVSPPAEAEVYSSSRFTIRTETGPYSIGSTISFAGRLEDVGGVPVSGSLVTISTDWGFTEDLTTDLQGYVAIPLRLPLEPGSYKIELGHAGSNYIGPASLDREIMTVDGPTIILESIETSLPTGSIIFINGSIFGLGPDPEGEVSIEVLSGSDRSMIMSRSALMVEGAFSLPLEIAAERFTTGTYVVNVEYDPGSSNIAVNASLSFMVTSRSYLALGVQKMVRGMSEELAFILLTGDLAPLSGETVALEFPGSPFLGSYTGRTNRTGWAVISVPLPDDIPLGNVPFKAEHVPGDGTVIGGSIEGQVAITAETHLELLDQPETLTLGDDIILSGRLIDDLGGGISGDSDIELVINGGLVASTGTDTQGFFEITYTISTFTPLGPGLITVRFTDIADERAGWYSSSFSSWGILVLSGVVIQPSIDMIDDNVTLMVSLRGQNREPVPNAQLKVGYDFSVRTYLTDDNGTLEVNMEGAGEGDVINIEFPGDPERYLVPSFVSIEVPPSNISSGQGVRIWIYISLSIVSLAAVAVVSGYMVNRFRRDKGSRRAEVARTDSLYDFKPREGSQEMICSNYGSVLSGLKEKGVGKPPEMTPDEYDEALRGSTGSGSLAKLEEMTHLFDEARYSDHEMSSHLITKAKTLSFDLKKEIGSIQDEGLRERFEKTRKEMAATTTRRHLPWKMRLDPEEELRSLLGDKGGGN